MRVLQVKNYHNLIARAKQEKALARWREKDNGYGYPIKSIFYFMLTDKYGYTIKERERGYIAFTDNHACFNLNKNKAIEMLNPKI